MPQFTELGTTWVQCQIHRPIEWYWCRDEQWICRRIKTFGHQGPFPTVRCSLYGTLAHTSNAMQETTWEYVKEIHYRVRHMSYVQKSRHNSRERREPIMWVQRSPTPPILAVDMVVHTYFIRYIANKITLRLHDLQQCTSYPQTYGIHCLFNSLRSLETSSMRLFHPPAIFRNLREGFPTNIIYSAVRVGPSPPSRAVSLPRSARGKRCSRWSEKLLGILSFHYSDAWYLFLDA